MVQQLDIFKGDLVQQWAPLFDQQGIGHPNATFDWVEEGELSVMNCTVSGPGVILVTTDDNNAYYCSSDNTIFMPVQTFITAYDDCVLFTKPTVCDDMSVGGVLAHEYGHAITYWLTDGWEQQGYKVEGPMGNNRELFPDCLAGMYFGSLQARGFDEEGDFDALVKIMGDIGDDDPSTPHGTPSERSDAVRLGATTNDITYCMMAYDMDVTTSG